jgi:manganese/zinc/iron transport system permease protein
VSVQFDYTLQTVALGAVVLGVTAGALGCYAMLRRQSLIGDVISHAALAGVALAFIVTGAQSPLPLLLGAALSGWAAAAFAQFTSRTTPVKIDTSLGIGLSVFFGLGILLRTLIQKTAGASQAGLDKFLLGNVSTLLREDIVTMAVLGGVALLLLALLWKEFKLATFDPQLAASQGWPVRALSALLTALIVIAIVIGLQTVGVVLMSALLIAPAAAARQWTDRLGVMVVLAATFGALAGISGAIVSATVERLPTGPVIVLVVTAIVMFSMLFAPNRGLLADALRSFGRRRRLENSVVLEGMLRMAESHADPHYAHEASALQALTGAGVERSLGELERAGLVSRSDGSWALTDRGLSAARQERSR